MDSRLSWYASLNYTASNKMKNYTIPTPSYVVYEDALRHNLQLISDVAKSAGVEIIMALKANALWKTFDIIGEYINASTASSINEMRLSRDYLCGDIHAYCPVYTDESFEQFIKECSHITFNSLSQWERFAERLKRHNESHPECKVSAGLRINPQCSVIDTDIYNPCLPGSRFGINAAEATIPLPEGIEGLHFHALCESNSHDLAKVLASLEKQFSLWLENAKWLNMGGGHLMTREGYDTDHLISLLKDFRRRHPNLHIIMEPGSAFTWRTSDLLTTILDVVEKNGVRTAIIDASFACHMPDCLEMPYKPIITEALPDNNSDGISYRLGGNSCLSGDYVGDWRFATPLKAGDRLTLEDMNHYTTVKTTMFNGISHPSIYLQRLDDSIELLRRYTYEDYRNRMC